MAGSPGPDSPGASAARVATAAVTAALAAGVFLVCLTPISDGDIFWHLAAGREMVHRHAWLRTDPFTLSAGGRPWVNVHWLFQLAAHAMYAMGGLTGVIVAKALAVAAGALVLAAAVGRSGGAVARALFAPAMIGALFVARHLLLARPVIVTLLMLALYFAALEQVRAGRRRGLFWLLPLLQILWTNCQGLAALGQAMIGVYLLAAQLPLRVGPRRWRWRGRWPFATEQSPLAASSRPLAVVLGLCMVASFVTPYGGEGATLPARLLARIAPAANNVFATQVAENVSPFVLERTAPAQIVHFKWYLAALALCLALGGRRLYLSHVLLLVGFGALALMANRNVLLFYWVATPIGVMAIAPRVERLLGAGARWGPVAGAVTLGAALTAVLALAAVAAHRESTLAQPTPFHFPTESTHRLVAEGARGPVFAPDHVGGYLAFTAPGLVPYIDTRLLLHTAGEYTAYLAAIDDGDTFDALAESTRFRYVILTTATPDRYLGLVQHLAASPAWELTFTDGSEVLFTRRGRAVVGDRDPTPLDSDTSTDEIIRGLAARFSRQPALHQAARTQLARLLIVLGETDQAQRVLSTLDGRAAVQLRARAHLVAGELAAAESLARTLLSQGGNGSGVQTDDASDARDVRTLVLMAQISILNRQPGAALDWLRRALAVDPYDVEARRLLESLSPAVSRVSRK